MASKRSYSATDPDIQEPSGASIPSSSNSASPPSKIKQLNPTPGASRPPQMRCYLPPHKPLSFQTYADYAVHYAQSHVNRCSACQRNLPSEHFLDLHIAENHDALVEARKARGEKTYSCFVEDCDRVCSTHFKRRLHLLDKHGFPKQYDFFIVNDGIDGRKSMLRPRWHQKMNKRRRGKEGGRAGSSEGTGGQINHQAMQAKEEHVKEKKYASEEEESSAGSDEGEDSENSEDEESESGEGNPDEDEKVCSAHMDLQPSVSSSTSATSRSGEPALTPSSGSSGEPVADLTKSMSALKFVPRSVRFGRDSENGSLE